MTLREIKLPTDTRGRLLLGAMPGRYEALNRSYDRLAKDAVDVIVCLAGMEEIRKKAPLYAQALASETLPHPVLFFEIPDFGVPVDRYGFLRLARGLCVRLQEGQTVFIHCGAGIGRTGTLATCVLMALGQEASAAKTLVRAAGSGAETPAQEDLIAWCESRGPRAT